MDYDPATDTPIDKPYYVGIYYLIKFKIRGGFLFEGMLGRWGSGDSYSHFVRFKDRPSW